MSYQVGGDNLHRRGEKGRNGMEELVMKALRVWEGDMLKHLKNTQKKRCIEHGVLTEGMLGFHHILLLEGAATTELSGLNSPSIFLQTA